MAVQRARLTLIAALAASLVGGVADAASYQANFNSVALDPSLSFYDPSGRFGEITGLGLLTVDQDANQAGTVSQALIASNFSETGNFSASITINAAALQPTSSLGTFSVNFGSVADSSQMAIGFNSADRAQLNYGYIEGGQSNNEYYLLQGAPYLGLRVDRVGDTVSQYVSRGGTNQWFKFSDVSSTGFLSPARFFFGLNNFAGSGVPGYVTYQNFTVESGSAVPEPETWVLMIIGIAFCGLALRKFRERVNIAT